MSEGAHQTADIIAGDLVVSVNFAYERDHLVALIGAPNPVLASCLTAAWKLVPDQLIESLIDHRDVTYGEFFTFSYEVGPDRDPEETEGVHIREDENEIVIDLETFQTLIVKLARLYFSKTDPSALKWPSGLSASARALLFS